MKSEIDSFESAKTIELILLGFDATGRPIWYETPYLIGSEVKDEN